MGTAFCCFEVLFIAHRLYMPVMLAGTAGVLRLYFRFLPWSTSAAITCGVALMRRLPYLHQLA